MLGRPAVAHLHGDRGDGLHPLPDPEGADARLLHEQHEISELFITHLLTRNTRFEEDLVDQLFNSSEKRLARILLLLAHFGKERGPKLSTPESIRNTWPKWSAPPGHGSVIS